MTSAPRSPRISHAYGAATLWPSSMTVRPVNGKFGPVMAGFVPAIHVLPLATKDVDARHKAGHDEREIPGHASFVSGKSAVSGAWAFFHTMMERSYSITTMPSWLTPRVRTFTTPW